MLNWIRRARIKEINIGGIVIEFSPAPPQPETPVSNDKTLTHTPDTNPLPIVGKPLKNAGSAPTLTIQGVVVGTIGKDLGIRVENETEVRAFWQEHQIDTQLDWAGTGPPVASIGRKADITSCDPGDEVRMTVKIEDRANGRRGIRTIAFEVVDR